MAIIEVEPGLDPGSPSIPYMPDSIDRWDVAKFALFDIAPYAIGLGIFTSLRKINYLRKLAKAEKAADKTVDTYKLGQAAGAYAEQHYIATVLFTWGLTSTALVMGSPVYVLYRTASDATEVYIGYRIDRDSGKLIGFIPGEGILRQLQSHRRQDTGLTSTYRSLLNPQGYYSGDGLSHLANTEWRLAPAPKWSPATPEVTTRDNRPMTTRPPLDSLQGSGPKGARPDQITPNRVRGPWCPRHRRKHWCPVTRPNQ